MITPEELFADAEKLLKAARTELDYRAVVERAYYAAYHAVLALEEALPLRSTASPAKGGSHESLIQRLERPHPQLEYGLRIVSQDLGAQMRILKPLREHASYTLDETVRVDHAEAALRGAKEVLSDARLALRRVRSAH